MKAAILTLGCKVNQYDSNALARALRERGFETAAPEEEADVYIVNSCTVTAESSRKSRQALRRLRHEHPDAVTVLTGCYPQAYPDAFDTLPEADIVTGNRTYAAIADEIETFLQTKKRSVNVLAHRKDDIYSGFGAASFEGHTRAFIKIQDGCNRYCTYCVIPVSRGFSRSRPLEDIRRELTTIAKNGYKEVVFVGINLSAYGLDTGNTICDALTLAEETDGIERIRLGSLEPDHITDEVIKGLARLKKFCPQFHLSLQSGCDRTLKRMNRHYTAAEYEDLCRRLKAAFPALSLTTDVIVGFPGETQADFEESLAFVKRMGFMKVHVFPYSPREGTPAANYPLQIENRTKAERCANMQRGCDALRRGFFDSLVGSVQNVLFETPKAGFQQGYAENYAPVSVPGNDPLTGEIRPVRVTGATEEGCMGALSIMK